MGTIGLVEIVAIPTRREEELRLHAVRTIPIEVEVVSFERISETLIDLTSKRSDVRGGSVERVARNHSEALRERDDGFGI